MNSGIFRGLRRWLAVAFASALLATPATAQFSDSYNFLKAVRDKDGGKVTEMLGGSNPTLVNTRDVTTGEGGLHVVVKRRDDQWTRFLLAKGANPNARDRSGNTPLMIAAQLGFPEGIVSLIQGKADVNLANDRGETPLIAAVQRRDLVSARILLGAGADPDKADHQAGMSARDYAARDPRAGVLLRLIEDTPKQSARKAEAAGPRL